MNTGRSKRLWWSTFAIIALTACIIAAPYAWFDYKSGRLAVEHGLKGKQGNSLKHSEAAGFLNDILLKFGLSSTTTEGLVLKAGYITEIAEQVIKSERDSTVEMMRDMANNLAGTTISNWQRKNDVKLGTNPYLEFAKADNLFSRPEQLGLSEEQIRALDRQSDAKFAWAWLKEFRPKLTDKIVQDIFRLKPSERANL